MIFRRWSRATVLLLHLLVVGLAPLADALATSAAAQSRVVHVEAPGRGGCPPAHDHLRCQVCRVIGHDALSGDRTAWSLALPCDALVPSPSPQPVVPRRRVASALGSRAPPAV